MKWSSNISTLTYVVVLLLAVLWVGGILYVPIAVAGGTISIASALSHAYGQVCHQIPERSFHLFGRPLGVCSRCSGIYVGYLLGLLIYPLVRALKREDAPNPFWLLIAMTPMAFDFTGGYIGLFEDSILLRAATGLIAGAALVFYTLPGVVSQARSILRLDPTPHEARRPEGADVGLGDTGTFGSSLAR
jgi:uncharacterized membrane protein